jgi:hypothetical protein
MSAKVHRPVSAGNPDRPTVICAECLVVWPCAAAHRAAAKLAMNARELEAAKARAEMRTNGDRDLFDAERSGS